jgi:hypothetical protein
MNIQRPINVGPGNGTQNVAFPETSGGTSPGAGEGLRADWNVRMNVSHRQGFVGGAGRLLIHNQTGDERTEVVLYLPAARPELPGTLRLLGAQVCSAKPGMPAVAGQPLLISPQGARVVVTVPVLRMNDWLYVDLTWDGSFPAMGASFPGGRVPLGEYHPQVAVDTQLSDGRHSLAPIPARYDVTLGSDVGARVQMEDAGAGTPVTRSEPGGEMSEHEFKSYGKAAIQAHLLPPGAVVASDAPASGSFDVSPFA